MIFILRNITQKVNIGIISCYNFFLSSMIRKNQGENWSFFLARYTEKPSPNKNPNRPWNAKTKPNLPLSLSVPGFRSLRHLEPQFKHSGPFHDFLSHFSLWSTLFCFRKWTKNFKKGTPTACISWPRLSPVRRSVKSNAVCSFSFFRWISLLVWVVCWDCCFFPFYVLRILLAFVIIVLQPVGVHLHLKGRVLCRVCWWEGWLGTLDYTRIKLLNLQVLSL